MTTKCEDRGCIYGTAEVASLARLMKIVEGGKIEGSDTVAVEITGSGLKDSQIAMRASLDVPVINPSRN